MRREHQLDKCGGGRCKCWPLEAVTSVVSGRVYSLPDKISLSHCSCHKLLAISFTAVLTCTTHTQFFLQCLSFQSDHFSFLLSLFRSFILPFALPLLFISFRFLVFFLFYVGNHSRPHWALSNSIWIASSLLFTSALISSPIESAFCAQVSFLPIVNWTDRCNS